MSSVSVREGKKGKLEKGNRCISFSPQRHKDTKGFWGHVPKPNKIAEMIEFRNALSSEIIALTLTLSRRERGR
jgi:hypothetical protein